MCIMVCCVAGDYVTCMHILISIQTAIFSLYWVGKNRVWNMDDTISVQTSTQSRVGDD